MATWKRWTGLALFVLAATGSAVFGDDKAKVSGDLKSVQGTWVNATESSHEVRWVFEGETMKATVNGTDHTTKVELDPKGNPHPTINLEITEGPDEVKGKKALGIYKLDGDKLTVCVGMPGIDKRPSDFKAVEDEAFLFELKRDKDK